jgi:hypothetical protein
MSVGETLSLIESEFLKELPPDVIAKKGYLYSIRHLYGLEGSRINRKPCTCADIVKKHPSKCPMAHASSAAEELDAAGVPRTVQLGCVRGGGGSTVYGARFPTEIYT